MYASIYRLFVRGRSTRMTPHVPLSQQSQKELRVQDYAQSRKTATTTNAFGGTTTAFGATQPAAANVFGQPTQQTGTSAFGTNTNTTTAFGAFGQPAPNTNTSAFGGGGGGAFGQTQPQPSNPFGSTGTFSQQQQQPQQTGLFGGTTSVFGSNTNKPAFGAFGSK